MAEMKFDIEFIKSLMELVSKNDMGELVIENGDAKIKIAAKRPAQQATAASAPAAVATQTVQVEGDEITTVTNTAPGGKNVVSPIVGTFYSAPSPDRDPFIEVGKKVKKGDVLFVVESMKLMNEIQSEYDGEVADILCTDGQAVEFGQTVVVIK